MTEEWKAAKEREKLIEFVRQISNHGACRGWNLSSDGLTITTRCTKKVPCNQCLSCEATDIITDTKKESKTMSDHTLELKRDGQTKKMQVKVTCSECGSYCTQYLDLSAFGPVPESFEGFSWEVPCHDCSKADEARRVEQVKHERMKEHAPKMYEALRTLDEYYANAFIDKPHLGKAGSLQLQEKLWEMSRAALEAADGLRWEDRHCITPSHITRLSTECDSDVIDKLPSDIVAEGYYMTLENDRAEDREREQP